jgi:hypothetical protein
MQSKFIFYVNKKSTGEYKRIFHNIFEEQKNPSGNFPEGFNLI